MPVKFKDYYETLGVAKAATPDEIKQAFRRLARIHHPDVAKNKVAGEAKFKEVNEAYEVLGDPDKRKRYDELGADWQDPAAAEQGARAQAGRGRGRAAAPDFEFGGTGYSDFFESFFGGSRDGYGSAGRAGMHPDDGGPEFNHPGRDVEADIMVTLEEALLGSRRKVTLRRPGDGGAPERTDSYNVRIPAGVRDGQRIRLAGQGGAGYGGGSAGDLYLRVRMASHPDFTVKGSDLYCDLDLAPWEAVLGTSARIPTLDGTTSLKVPAGTAAGSQLRLKGLGMPNGDGGRGDLYATARILVPSSVSPEERPLWEKLSSGSDFKPRKTP
jgi:curved DNA-binding protein